MIRSEARSRLGYSSPSYARSVVFSGQYVHALADELGEWWWRIVRDAERASAGRTGLRVERAHQEDAASELIEYVRSMSRPVRDVVERRASGMSVRAIAADLPGRAHFSVEDDWRGACRRIFADRPDVVSRLS